MILTPSDVASVAIWSKVWEFCEYASEAVVFFGCIGEFIAEYTKWRTEEWRHSLGRRSLIILTLGIGAGLFSLIKTNALAGVIVGSLGEQAKQASDTAGAALTKSKQADLASTIALDNSREALGIPRRQKLWHPMFEIS